MSGRRLIAWGRTAHGAELLALMAAAEGLHDHVPKVVRREYVAPPVWEPAESV